MYLPGFLDCRRPEYYRCKVSMTLVILLGFLQDNCCMAHYLIVLEEKTIIYWIVGLYFGVFCAFVSDIDTFIGYVLYKQ
jgi:hypothetical protein